MKGLFIPEITAEMFRNGCLEGIEALMAEVEYDDELILKSDVIELIDRYYDKFIYESDADELIVEIESMQDIRSK